MSEKKFSDEEINQMALDYQNLAKKTIPISVNGKEIDFSWPKHDVDCILVLLYDWPNHDKIIDKYVKNNGAALMAGGNAGLYPFFYSLRFEKVYTFEPDLLNFACLVDNCSTPNVIKFNTGLSDKTEFVGFHLSLNNNGMHYVTEDRSASAFDIFTIAIDSLNIPELSLIHLDTEGCELKIFKGAIETIKRCRPVILTDLTIDEEEITNLLVDLGYEKKEEYGIEKTAIFVPKE